MSQVFEKKLWMPFIGITLYSYFTGNTGLPFYTPPYIFGGTINYINMLK